MKDQGGTCYAVRMVRFSPLLVALAGCNLVLPLSPAPDGGVSDVGPVQDHGPLLPCDRVGLSCKANDPCAIRPVCREDHICIPADYQRCDDGLTCTADVCKAMGLCEHVPLSGTCALIVQNALGANEVRCFQAGDTHPDAPCLVCDPDVDPAHWTRDSKARCDDHDPCTLDDQCVDGECIGQDYGLTCVDELGCTVDECDGQGGCTHVLKNDWCLIGNTCHPDKALEAVSGACVACNVKISQSQWTPVQNACVIDGVCRLGGAQHPTGACAVCDPAQNAQGWSVTPTGCLIDDQCHLGGAKDSTGCNVCKPTSPTTWTPLLGLCGIDGQCYAQGAKNPTAPCSECDTAVSPVNWTVKNNDCLIAKQCYASGQVNAGGCASCDSNLSRYDWTPTVGKCLIHGACFNNGDVHPTGCMSCLVGVNPTGWVGVSTTTVSSDGFEIGASSWTLTQTDPAVRWHVSNRRPATGRYSLYYGNPATGNYASGVSANSGSATMPSVTLPSGKQAGLIFMLYMDTETYATYDTLTVFVGTTPIWTKPAAPPMKSWTPIDVDLTPFAGQTISIRFEFDTVDSLGNGTEGVFIDDVTLYSGC